MDLMMAEANKLDVDVLCWGGTHRFDAYEYENKFFVNPGSATGAFTCGWVAEGEEEGTVPSFCLMDVSLKCSFFASHSSAPILPLLSGLGEERKGEGSSYFGYAIVGFQER